MIRSCGAGRGNGMRTYLECVPCFFKQALEASKLAGANVRTQKKILDAVARAFVKFPLRSTPPEMGRRIYQIVNAHIGVRDPYRKIKADSNRKALRLYPQLRARIARSKDRLLTAVELAIAGNIIDYGVKNSLNVDHELTALMKQEERAIRHENKKLFAFGRFRAHLKKARTVLYLGDNAGEIVFDRLLIEEIKRRDGAQRIIYAVRGKPVINDVLMKDAHDVGLDAVTEVIPSGSDAPGTVLSLCSQRFLHIFKKADMVISKGQGNFEALSQSRRPVFFLFIAKCPVIARHVGCRLGDVILSYQAR